MFAQNTQKGNQTLKMLHPTILSTNHDHLKIYCFLPRLPTHTEKQLRGRGDKIVVGTVVKANIGELEEEVRAGCPRSSRKELTGMVQGISGKKRFLVRFQYGCKNNLSLNQLTILIVEKIPEEKEPGIFTNPEIPEEKVALEQGYYHCVYVMIRFNKEVGVETKEDQADVEDDHDEEEMEDVKLDDERERHWRMVFEENYGGVDDKKALLHANRCDVYVNEKKAYSGWVFGGSCRL